MELKNKQTKQNASALYIVHCTMYIVYCRLLTIKYLIASPMRLFSCKSPPTSAKCKKRRLHAICCRRIIYGEL